MKPFFSITLFVIGAIAILKFGLPNIYSEGGMAALVIAIGGFVSFYGASTAIDKTPNSIMLTKGMFVCLFLMGVVVAFTGLTNIYVIGKTSTSLYLLIVGILAALFSAAMVSG